MFYAISMSASGRSRTEECKGLSNGLIDNHLPGVPMDARCVGSWRKSVPEGVLDLREELVGLELPPVRQVHNVVVVHQEKVAGGVESPPKAGVAAHRARIGIVLHKTAQVEVGGDIHEGTDANQGRFEVALAESPDVVLPVELDDEQGRRLPGPLDLDLVEVTVIEAAEAPGQLAGECAPRREFGLQAVAHEIVGAGRDH